MDRHEIYEQLKEFWSDCEEMWPNIEADRDYWTTPDMTVAKIRAKYKIKKWKPEPIGVDISCADCGQQEIIVLRGNGIRNAIRISMMVACAGR